MVLPPLAGLFRAKLGAGEFSAQLYQHVPAEPAAETAPGGRWVPAQGWGEPPPAACPHPGAVPRAPAGLPSIFALERWQVPRTRSFRLPCSSRLCD